MNVGIGAYRTDEGKPWVLPTVKKVEKLLVNDPEIDHEYLPIDGLASFTEASARLVLGHSSPAILNNRVISPKIVARFHDFFSIAPFKPFQEQALYVSVLLLLPVSLLKPQFTFLIQLGDHIAPFSGIVDWKLRNILIISVKLTESTLMAG